MLSRAEEILKELRCELEMHHRALEVNVCIRRINFTLIIGERSGEPVKVIYSPISERDVTEGRRSDVPGVRINRTPDQCDRLALHRQSPGAL